MFMAFNKKHGGRLIGLIGFMGTAVMKKELASRRCKLFFVGAEGFEPPTLCL